MAAAVLPVPAAAADMLLCEVFFHVFALDFRVSVAAAAISDATWDAVAASRAADVPHRVVAAKVSCTMTRVENKKEAGLAQQVRLFSCAGCLSDIGQAA